MGNLIRDFWTYQYKNKSYYGIVEVISGEDIAQIRNIKKYETHIEKALGYLMKPGRRIVSHISQQTYCGYMKDGKAARNESEEKYYPFCIEFECKSETGSDYKEVVAQALTYITYLIYELGVDEKDILAMINNSRSIYVLVNPKVYGLKPDKDLHRIYKAMYEKIDDEIGLNYVDVSMYSHYKLWKAPNCYYKGGYFVNISFAEMKRLYQDPGLRKELTSSKRSLNFTVPGKTAYGMASLYENAKDKVKQEKKFNASAQVTFIKKDSCRCVEYMENYLVEKGHRNYALVSIAINKKNQGYSKDQVQELLIRLAGTWRHDENANAIKSKVNAVWRRDYQFSCEYARSVYAEMGIEDLCKSCRYCQKNQDNGEIKVYADIINELWKNNASTRHYITLLELTGKGLFGKWFNPEQEGMNERYVRELASKARTTISRRKDGEYVIIENLARGNVYNLPKSFLEKKTHIILGESLKHYLKLLIKGYKAYSNYILIRVTKEKIRKDLGYKELTGVYVLLKKLEAMGLLKQHRNNVISLYNESYKVKDIQEHKKTKAAQKEQPAAESRKVANGTQHSPYYPETEAFIEQYNIFRLLREGNRGSPG